jgi:RNA polymerase sigma factor (sigma-70 family)
MAWSILTSEEQISLAQAIREDRPGAGEEFVRLFGERIRVMMVSRLRDAEEARELTQEALFAGWRVIREGRLRDPERLAAFVLGTARNVLNSYARAHAGITRPVPLTEDLLRLPAPAESRWVEHRRLVAVALKGLSAEDRLVLRLTFVDGLAPREIAARLGLGMEVVRARKSRAIKRVVEAVAKLSRNDAGRY